MSLTNKDKEINELKLKISYYPFEINKGEKLMSIIFISNDQQIHHSIICKNTDIFINVEKSLYDELPEYKETDNFFMVNGMKVNKFKSMDENKIKNNSIITLVKIE